MICPKTLLGSIRLRCKPGWTSSRPLKPHHLPRIMEPIEHLFCHPSAEISPSLRGVPAWRGLSPGKKKGHVSNTPGRLLFSGQRIRRKRAHK